MFDALFDDTGLSSAATLTPRTEASTSDGGYSGTAYTDGTTSTIRIFMANNFPYKTNLERFGELRSGEIRVVVKGDQSVDNNDKITINSQVYYVREIREIRQNDVTIYKSLRCSRVLD